ncbi:26S proteasome non-ATPase regulatory subunit 8 homolog A-like isoform X2 [Solanum dulcamara]|uniref:26S proteasome non-ATPase regulatory subunit 8 homolog A-like isoform X2 n=1 Tax=Solanum dulcamara TaxID=45834 RepID=UPI002484E0F8|nr:26S proteasome non-ATPase regulatory subunit 8 homolog A-like isoform X2 [Solanum dulcamara]
MRTLVRSRFFFPTFLILYSNQKKENLGSDLNFLIFCFSRIAEFHTEHELLSPSALDNACIKHAVELEQSFMAGANHRVLSARETVHDATYAYFMDLLAKTVRFFGMAINNVPWNQKVPRP